MALERHPELAQAFTANGHEIAAHGWRWISYQAVDEATERNHVALAVEAIARLTGTSPAGWYTGRDSPNTRRLVVDHGGFEYDSDSYSEGAERPKLLSIGMHARLLGRPGRFRGLQRLPDHFERRG